MKNLSRFLIAPVVFAILLVGAGLGHGTAARSPSTAAELLVEDSGSLFSADAIAKAKKTVAGSIGEGVRRVHVETFKALTDAEEKDYKAAGDDKAKLKAFWNKWAQSKIAGDRGFVILIVRHPGHVHPLVDRQMRDAGFSEEKEEKVTKMLLDSFHKAAEAKDAGKTADEQQAIRDEGLQTVAEYLKTELPKSVVEKKQGGGDKELDSGKTGQSQGIGIGGWICIGIVAFLGIWLVIGLVRAFSGGGGGGGMGGGMGGGGGFFTGLLGGMFGGLAGMWIYDRFFGGGGSSAYGGHGGMGSGDYYGGDSGGTVDTPGGGDFSGDSGGGGDFGGDIGGGGGDFGGGGGDMGGGGDF